MLAQYPYLASNTVNEYGWNADVQICFGGCDPVVLDGSQYNATCSDHPFCASADDDGNLIWKKCPNDWMLNPMDMGEGYMNYDNILSSIWLLLCHITLEGWSGTMYDMGVDGGVQMWTSRVFHLLWVLIGAVFLIQLMTAIIASKYFAAKEEELTLRARIALDEEAILQTAQVIASKQAPERPLKRSAILMETASKFTAGDAIQRAKQVAKKLYDSIPGFKLMYTFVADTLFRIRICCRIVVKHRLCQPFILACIVLNTICMVIEFHDQDKFETSLCEQRCKLDASLPANATCTGPLFNRTLDLDAHGKRVRPAQNSFCFLESNLAIADSVVCSNLQTAADCYASDSNCFWVPEKKGIFGFGDEGYKSCKLGLYSADSFGVGALSLRQLCGDDDPTIQCPAFDPNTSKVLTLINLVLTIIFIAEMVLKMLGMGLFAPVVQQDGDASSFRQGTLKHLSMDPMLPDRQTSIFRAGTGLQGPDRQDSIFRAGTGLQGPGRTGSGSNEGTGGSRTIFRDRTRRPNLIRGNTFRDKYAHVEFEGYFEDSWNCFDFLIVCFSIVELISTATSEGQTSNGLFSVLRTMRLFRLFKLFRNWHEMRKIVGTLGTAMRSLQLVLFLYCLVAYIFALLAMNLFAREFKFVKTANPRSNFDLFSTSFFTVFQIVTTENWTTVAYNCITARGVLGGIFPFIIVFVGNYIIMNLFVAILLSKMTDEEVDHTLQLVNEAEQEHEQPGETNARLDSRRNLMPQNTGLTAESSGILTVAASFRQTFRQSMARVLPDAKNNTVQEPRANHFSASQGSQGPQFALGGAMAILKLDKDDVDVDIMAVELKDTFLKHFMAVKNKHGIHRRIRLPAHNALCLFSPRNPLRVLMAYISHNPWFDKVIIGCILVSSVLLMVEAFDPRSETRATRCDTSGLDCRYRLPGQVSFPSADEDYVCPVRRDEDGFDTKFGPCGSADEAPCCADVRLHAALSQMDNVFTAIFLLEMIIKLISEGVLFHKLAYLRSWWNVLDAGVVIISVLTFVLKLTGSTIDLKMLKALRTFRVLRPLRIVKRNPQLKTTVTCIISSIPAMLTVAVVLLLYLFVIGMFFSNIYKGRFFRCYDPQDQIYYGSSIYPLGNLYTADQALSGPTSVPTIIECVTKTQGLGVWQDAPTSFNTISTALQTLFEMATTEGWLQVMGSMTDATGVGITPQPDLNLHLAPILCLLHVLVGNFIMLNLLVSSIINNYIRIKNKLDGISLMMTAEQQEWKETVTWIRQLKPRTREKAHINPWRNALKNLANSTGFNTAITLTIFANFAVMLSKQHDDSCQTQANMVWANVGFAVIFAIEAAIKLLGLGLNFYFMDSWNRLDFGLVGLSFVTIALDFASGSHLCTGKAEEAESFPALTALRAIRIVRVFRLIKRFEGLQKMISTLISSLPALVNIISLIALFLFIFAVLGTMLFWNVNQEQDLYGGVDGDGNYGRFDMSFFLLFRQATGETWNAIMFYCSQSDLVLACDDTRTDYQDPIACGSPVLGVAYHILWQAFGTYMLMQLITAVIIQNFEDMVKAEVAVIPEECKNSFVDKWNVFDPDGTSHITVVQLAQLIAEVKPPLGIKSNQFTSSVKVMAVIKDLNIPVRMQEIDRPPEPGSTEPASGTKLVACVRYHDTFIALVRRAHTLLPEDEEEEDLYASPEASSPESESDDDEVGDLYDESQRKSKHPSKRSRLEEASTEDDEGEDGDPSFMFSNPTVAQDYAARQLQHACIAWREKKLQVEKCQDLEVPIPLDRKHALPVLKSPNRTPRPNGAP